jgi:hypothetical protein
MLTAYAYEGFDMAPRIFLMKSVKLNDLNTLSVIEC